VSFPVGDAISFCARPGDSLRVLRTRATPFGMIVTRGGDLVLAVGALWKRLPERHADVVVMGAGRVRVSIGGVRAHLRARESGTLGPYDVYIKSVAEVRSPKRAAAYGSIVRAGDTRTTNAARRSAVLLGKSGFHGWLDQLRGEAADGNYIRAAEPEDSEPR